MKKTLFLSAIACSMAFYACKKDNDNSVVPPVVDPPIDSIVPVIDPVALSANVKIGYGGTSVAGNIPAASADAPVLDPLYDGLTYYAISNRYVVIYPNVSSGFVKGYYLQINGSGSSYKIDYTLAAGLRKAANQAGLREDHGAGDSTIVIKLPAGLKGDTFSIKYAAYDSLNRVSAPLSAVVSIIASPSATDDAKLIGSWELLRQKYNTNKWDSSPSIGNPYDYYGFYCVNDKLSYSSAEEVDQATSYPANIDYYYIRHLHFSANNAAIMSNTTKYVYLDMDLSTCGSPVYTASYDVTYKRPGGYSYDAANKTLVFIRDEDGYGSNLYSQKYTVVEATSDRILFYETGRSEGNDELSVYYYDYQKTK